MSTSTASGGARRLVFCSLIGFALLGGLLAFPCAAAAQTTAPSARAAMAPIEDKPGLPRVLLIGDSISIGYTLDVRERLNGVANVHRIPMNGGPTTRGLAKIETWLGKGRWDVIHFNWGLHDLKQLTPEKRQVPLDEYEKNLRQLVARLKQTGATLIWATTTPVPEGAEAREPKDVTLYNAAALRIMRENGIAIDDLYTFALPQLTDIQLTRNVHYTDKGYATLAAPVAASIRKGLSSPRPASSQPAATTQPACRLGAAATKPACCPNH